MADFYFKLCNGLQPYSPTPLYGRHIHPNIQRIIVGNTSTSTGWGCTTDIGNSNTSNGLYIFYSNTVKGLHVIVNKRLSDS